MHPDRMGKSKWVKVLPWHYTSKRQASRRAAVAEAVVAEGYPAAYEDCDHDHMGLGVSPAGRFWFCPECGWRRDAENRQ